MNGAKGSVTYCAGKDTSGDLKEGVAEISGIDLRQPVDIRHIATLVDQAKTALLFHNVIGYSMPDLPVKSFAGWPRIGTAI